MWPGSLRGSGWGKGGWSPSWCHLLCHLLLFPGDKAALVSVSRAVCWVKTKTWSYFACLEVIRISTHNNFVIFSSVLRRTSSCASLTSRGMCFSPIFKPWKWFHLPHKHKCCVKAGCLTTASEAQHFCCGRQRASQDGMTFPYRPPQVPQDTDPGSWGEPRKKIHPAPWWQEDAFRHCTHSGSKVLEIGPLLNVFILSLCYSLSNSICHNKDYQRPRKLRNGSTSLWAAVFKVHWIEMFLIKKMQEYDMYWENILALSYRR